jgi:hypothetical protein
MPKNKVSWEAIQSRRELIRGLIGRGVTTPARIYNQPDIKPLYQMYKNPYTAIHNDIKRVREELLKLEKMGTLDDATIDYKNRLLIIYEQLWVDYQDKEGDDKIPIMTKIIEISDKLAIADGLDPKKISPSFRQLEVTGNINNMHWGGLNDEQHAKYLGEYSLLFEPASESGSPEDDTANLPEDGAETNIDSGSDSE